MTTTTEERVARVESELAAERPHLATKADIAELRGELRGVKAGLWIVGALVVLIEALTRLGV